MNRNTDGINLLPNYFKKISYTLLAVSIVFLLAYKIFTLPVNKEVVKELVKNGILISLLILALSRDKVEDERTLKLRLNAFAISFVFGVAFLVAHPFVILLFDSTFLADVGAYQLVLTMLFFYFGMFSLAKKSR